MGWLSLPLPERIKLRRGSHINQRADGFDSATRSFLERFACSFPSSRGLFLTQPRKQVHGLTLSPWFTEFESANLIHSKK